MSVVAPIDYTERLAERLAGNPELIAQQIRQHRDIVAGLQAEMRTLRSQHARELRDLRATHAAELARYECPNCPAKADHIEEHECDPPRFDDPPDRERWEVR